MASSSKPRPASSTQRTTSGKARTIAAKRSHTLPRQVHASALDASETGSESAPQTPAVTTRTKTRAAAGRKAAKPKEAAAAKDVAPVAPKKPRAPRAKKRPAAVEKALPVLAPEPPAAVDAELRVEASAILEETVIDDAPFALAAEAITAPAPSPRKPGVVTAVWRLVSTLSWWTRLRH